MWGVRDPEAIIDTALAKIFATVESEVPDPRGYAQIASDIGRFCRNLIAGKDVGD